MNTINTTPPLNSPLPPPRPAGPPKGRYLTEERPLAVSYGTPACRLVVVVAWPCPHPDGTFTVEHAIRPVVLIETTIFRVYSIYVVPGQKRDAGVSEEALLRDGWQLDGQEVRTRHLVVAQDGQGLEDGMGEGTDACLLAACPWEVSEDADRLRDVVARARAMAEEEHLADRARGRPAAR